MINTNHAMNHKIIHVALSVFVCVISFSQDFTRFLEPIARQHNLTEQDLASYTVSKSYYRRETKMQHVYLQQTVNATPIFNALLQLHIHDENKLIFHNSTFVVDAQSKIDASSPEFDLATALDIVKTQLNLDFHNCGGFKQVYNGTYQLNCPTHYLHPIRAKLIYFPTEFGALKLGYEFAIEPLKTGDSWTIVVSAVNGELLFQYNRTLVCQFDHSEYRGACAHQHHLRSDENEGFQTRNLGQAVYNAYPLNIESPLHGPRALLNAVELPMASPFGWHDVNGAPGAEYTITRGNNVFAHEDLANTNEPGYSPNGGSQLIFDFPYLEGQDPLLSMDASITNLFVWNNFLHDVSFFYGFDEVSGNFQATNYSGEGFGDDYVLAHALDGSGTNNANFGTPEEGLNPVMQMFIWNHTVGSLLEILEPEVIAGGYVTGSSTFGVAPPVNPITAEVILVNDGSSSPTLGCGTLINGAQLAGKIAYFDRGGCTFVAKVQNAQSFGAVAVIIANNQQGGAMSMGGTDNGTVSIPVLSISQADGNSIKAQLQSGQTVVANFGGEFEVISFDSSFDNGIIAHEYGHGISNRLTGGPFEVSCLWNNEQMGEGWSDFFALIVSDTIGTTGTMPRGIGNFASNRPADAFGIRPFPYTTDMSINPLTYSNIQNLSIPHGVGSVWCTMLWDLYWAMVDEYGHSYNLYSNSGGNNKAIRLVMEGMRLQSCNPGFIDGRDAILAADVFLYGGVNQCLIWDVFARRGLGWSANQGSSFDVGDETQAFNKPPFCIVGLGETVEQAFVVYPNPGSDNVTIKSNSSGNIERIVVRNLTGALIQVHVSSSESVELLTDTWANGVYILEVHTAFGRDYFRWVRHN
jgi:extracellular elastinolytic metalloproteinase